MAYTAAGAENGDWRTEEDVEKEKEAEAEAELELQVQMVRTAALVVASLWMYFRDLQYIMLWLEAEALL